MKLAGVLAAILLFSVSGVRAQSMQAPIQASPYFLVPAAPNFFAAATPAPAALALSAASAPAPAPAPAPQSVQGVFPSQYWQLYIGYSYLRFYEVPGTTVNASGVQASMAYNLKDWLAAEGEVNGGVAKQSGVSSKLLFAGAGLRAKYNISRGYDVWVHAVGGGAHLTPETSYGGENALAYEFGAGADLNMTRHLSYRAELDLLGTRYFSTYQVSPRLSGGLVYNF
jgi:Outer membrane protein beta-barrel domain